MNGDFFIWTAVMLDLVAGVCYGYAGDLPRSIYWVGAGVITCSTLFMGGR